MLSGSYFSFSVIPDSRIVAIYVVSATIIANGAVLM